jgi:hypothetical protein
MAPRCAECRTRARVKGRTRCSSCLSRIAKTAARETWRNRKAVKRLLSGPTAPRPGAAPTLARDIERLIGEADAAAAKALEAAHRVGRLKPARPVRAGPEPEVEDEPIEDLDMGLEGD